MEASVHIDWYSFTVPTTRYDNEELTDVASREYVKAFEQSLRSDMSHAFDATFGTEGWRYATGRRPYRGGFRNDNFGIYVWYGGQKTILCEVSGNGCQILRDQKVHENSNALAELIRYTNTRATRIDFAVDLYTKTRPYQFVTAGYNKRIKASGDIRSQSGATYYVGSRKSKSRYARVYRYDDEKHAHRRHLLRVEMVALKKYASDHARYVTSHGVAYAAQMMNNYFKWRSPEMPELENHNGTINAPKRITSDDGRVAWLRSQVAPAVRDLLARGVITEQELLELFNVDIQQLALPLDVDLDS